MEKNELIAKINETLADEFEVEVADITPDANIKETLQLDSLSLVDMVALIEAEFGVKIKGSEMVQVQTFQALYDFIAERTAGAESSNCKLYRSAGCGIDLCDDPERVHDHGAGVRRHFDSGLHTVERTFSKIRRVNMQNKKSAHDERIF